MVLRACHLGKESSTESADSLVRATAFLIKHARTWLPALRPFSSGLEVGLFALGQKSRRPGGLDFGRALAGALSTDIRRTTFLKA